MSALKGEIKDLELRQLCLKNHTEHMEKRGDFLDKEILKMCMEFRKLSNDVTAKCDHIRTLDKTIDALKKLEAEVAARKVHFEIPPSERKECQICFCNDAVVMLFPCEHDSICGTCIRNICPENGEHARDWDQGGVVLDYTNKCPECRVPINSFVRDRRWANAPAELPNGVKRPLHRNGTRLEWERFINEAQKFLINGPFH